MKQLLERKRSTRIIVFALLLTMVAWLAPANIGVVKAAEGDMEIPVDGGCLYFDPATGTITGYEGNITDVDLSTISEENKITIKAIGEKAFYFYQDLSSVSIPDSVTTIGDDAFGYCGSLNSVSIPGSVTTIGDGAFHGCSASITVSADNQNYSSKDGVLFDKAKKRLIQYPIGNERTSYEIPDSVTTIEQGAFEYCGSLSSVSIPDSVTTIGSSAFRYCGLTSVSIPGSVITIGDWAFDRSDLTSVEIPNSVTSIGIRTFQECSSLTSVEIPGSVASIGDCAFLGCSGLTSVNIPDSVTSIGSGAFDGCSSLSSVSIPDSVTRIGDSAFSGCSSLTSVTIPNSVTSIGSGAFDGCSSLTSVSIPDSVTSIGNSAFGYQWEGGKVPGFKIYGYSNDSAAAKYAKENGFEYILVNNAKKAEQTISGANSFTKTYGDKAFYLNAKAKTNLTYKTSDQNVATVNGSGKVTIKGTGKATITITAAATVNYNSATKKVTITVKPKKVASVKVKKGRKQMTVSWKKDSKATGYQVTYAQNKAFTKGKKNVNISKNKTVKTTVKKLKPKKTYYVKVRAYKKAGSTKIYGAYSPVKTVKVK